MRAATGATDSKDPRGPHGLLPRALGLGVVGGLAFWLVNFLISLTPLGATYRAGLSISYAPMLVESLLGGLVVGWVVSFVLLRFFDRIPGDGPIRKSFVLTVAALFVIEIASVVLDLDQPFVYLVLGLGINGLRFSALAWAVGQASRRVVGLRPDAVRAAPRPTHMLP